MTLPIPEILDRLELSGHRFLAALEGVSEGEWRRKPRAEAWSMEEVAEHLAIVEAQVRKLILEVMGSAPASPEVLAATTGKLAVIDQRMDDPEPRTAPEATQPKGRWATPAELAESFRRNRQRILDYMRSAPADPDTHAWEHPAFGALTLRQWLFFLARHTERHTRQIDNLAPRAP